MKFEIVKKNNIRKIQLLFKKVFRKKISEKFYKWRYLDKNSFSYINSNKKKFFHIGFVEKTLNNKNKNLILSRHSSMVDQMFQRKGIYSNFFSNFLKKKKINEKYSAIVTWPNQINLKTFNKIEQKYIFKKIFMYTNFDDVQSNFKTSSFIKIKNIYKLINLNKLNSNISFFYKDKKYFIKRFLKDPHQKYYFYPITINDKLTFIIFTIKIIDSTKCVAVQDYYGQKKYFMKSYEIFIKDLKKKKIPLSFWKFWSGKNKPKFLKNFKKHFINYNIVIVPLKKKIQLNLNKKLIFMGDTDLFMKLA